METADLLHTTGHHDCCDAPLPPVNNDAEYRKVIFVCLGLTTAAFLAQTTASYIAGSVALLAAAMHFLSHIVNYVVSLLALSWQVKTRAYISLVRGGVLLAGGLWIGYEILHHGFMEHAEEHGALPDSLIMAIVAVMMMGVHIACASLLFRYRHNTSNHLSTFMCSRNDAIQSFVILGTGLAVYATGSAMPDLLIAAIFMIVSLDAARSIITKALKELKTKTPQAEETPVE